MVGVARIELATSVMVPRVPRGRPNCRNWPEAVLPLLVKFAARLEAATARGKPVLRVDYDVGHTGFDAIRRQEDLNTADMVAFVWQTGDPYFQP